MKMGAWEIDGAVLDLFISYIKSEKKTHIFRIPPGKCGLYHTGSHATFYLSLLESSFILEVSGLHILGLSTSHITMCDFTKSFPLLTTYSWTSYPLLPSYLLHCPGQHLPASWEKLLEKKCCAFFISERVFSQPSSQINYLHGIRILGENSF